MKKIEVQSLTVGYHKTDIVKDIDLSIPEGKITTIIGPNGCGKSTLLKAIANVLEHRGKILIDQRLLETYSYKDLARKLSFLPQKPEATNGLTVNQLVTYGRHPYASRFGGLSQNDYDHIRWAIHVTGLDHWKDKRVDELSGGQRQRVWIALCLAQDTEIIFLDEPTTYLDIAHQLEILELLKDLNVNHKKTIVMVLHDLNQASKYADHLIGIKDGNIIKTGHPNKVITKYVIETLFNIETDIIKDAQFNKPLCTNFRLLGV